MLKLAIWNPVIRAILLLHKMKKKRTKNKRFTRDERQHEEHKASAHQHWTFDPCYEEEEKENHPTIIFVYIILFLYLCIILCSFSQFSSFAKYFFLQTIFLFFVSAIANANSKCKSRSCYGFYHFIVVLCKICNVYDRIMPAVHTYHRIYT